MQDRLGVTSRGGSTGFQAVSSAFTRPAPQHTRPSPPPSLFPDEGNRKLRGGRAAIPGCCGSTRPPEGGQSRAGRREPRGRCWALPWGRGAAHRSAAGPGTRRPLSGHSQADRGPIQKGLSDACIQRSQGPARDRCPTSAQIRSPCLLLPTVLVHLGSC